MMTEGGSTPEQRLQWAFQVVLARGPVAAEQAVLLARYREVLGYYGEHEKEATRLISVGESTVPKGLESTQLAAYTVLASLLLNLDETVMRE